jgi:hypothetical protein
MAVGSIVLCAARSGMNVTPYPGLQARRFALPNLKDAMIGDA